MASKKFKRGVKKRQKEALSRAFGDLEVHDAQADIRIPVTREDVERAEKKNPERCVLAQSCMREFGSSAAVFFKSRAYVDVVGPNGKRVVERFTVGPDARAIIESFDRDEPFPAEGQWLTLRKPQPSETLDYKYEERKRREARQREAIRKGTFVPKPGYARDSYSEPRGLEVREGRGQVQMIQAKKRSRRKAA